MRRMGDRAGIETRATGYSQRLVQVDLPSLSKYMPQLQCLHAGYESGFFVPNKTAGAWLRTSGGVGRKWPMLMMHWE